LSNVWVIEVVCLELIFSIEAFLSLFLFDYILFSHNATSRFVMEMVTSLDMKLYEYAKHLAESQLETEKAGLLALAQFRKKHPARMRRRLQPTHSAPAHEFTRGQQMMKEMKQRISPVIESKRYVEGPFC
jgi:hypothetical protein